VGQRNFHDQLGGNVEVLGVVAISGNYQGEDIESGAFALPPKTNAQLKKNTAIVTKMKI